MTKAQVKAEFIENELGNIPRDDIPALNEAWNNYTDMLCRSRLITLKQYETWTHPVFTKNDWLKALEIHKV